MSTDYVIRAINISKSYQMGEYTLKVLKGVSVQIKRGEFVAIMGPSGSGKSTLMHILGLLDRFDSGQLFIDGKDVATLSKREIAKFRGKKIGFVFQNFNLLSKYNVLDNVLLPAEYVKIDKPKYRAFELLEKVGLNDRIFHKPNQLSGGQKQRVAIARALLADPSIILADEPTGNLDSKTGVAIMELFKTLNTQGKTVVLITHNPEMKKWVERVIYIKDGQIVR